MTKYRIVKKENKYHIQVRILFIWFYINNYNHVGGNDKKFSFYSIEDARYAINQYHEMVTLGEARKKNKKTVVVETIVK